MTKTKYRKNIRLKNYDYRTDGAYFVTICTNYRKRIILETEKQIIEKVLSGLSDRYHGATLDTYSIMPTHIHFIIFLENSSTPLSRIVQAFKSLTTLELKDKGFIGPVFWQRNYFEHVIRNDRALYKIREYIINNPHAMQLKLKEIYDQKD